MDKDINAIGIVRQMIADGQVSQEVAEKYFPELKESESLRIIKAIKYGLDHVFTNNTTIFEVTKEQCLSWLEKQGEHANFRNKIKIGDKVTRNKDGVLVNLSQLKRVAKKDEKQGEQKPADKQFTPEQASVLNKHIDKFLEQKPVWSEEDENEVAILEAYIRSGEWSESHIDRALGIVDELVNKVKSLRPTKQWKPSDEQMEALRYVTNFDYGGHKATLVSLYEQLKKLREE